MLLLASASPARRRLLEQAGIPHRVQVSGVDEAALAVDDPVALVQRLAWAKAAAVLQRLDDGAISQVLGCDSVLVFGGEVFGKPADAEEAVARWRRMAGGWGELHTGHCLLAVPAGGPPAMAIDGPGADPTAAPHGPLPERLTTVTTRVQFAPLTDQEIEAYVASGEPLHCAGGFALEGRGGALVERLEGCFSNVIGLSLPLLRRWLAAAA